MIMTQTKEASTTFESKSPAEQMNGHSMTGTERRDQEESGSSSTSPLSDNHLSEDTSSLSVRAMGSSDSAGSAHGGGPSCGLVSSLFPSSCRGRAEAFARRLHRRLTSLGGENSSSKHDPESNLGETSWLHPTSVNNKSVTSSATTANHVLQCQPRHSPESDLYYDFDLELEDGPGSPAEEATAAEVADLLVNPKILKTSHHDGCHCSPSGTESVNNRIDPESGFVYASPTAETSPDSDSSETYFDPESSDAERQKNSDPIASTSDSDAASVLSNGDGPIVENGLSRRRIDPKVEVNDTSESSSSLKNNKAICEKKRCQENRMCSSEESLNGRSSLETTSASHESLWSTFDESTLSLQDESPSKIEAETVYKCLSKSHSDSEIPINGDRIILACDLQKSAIQKREDDVDEVDFVQKVVENGTIHVSIDSLELLADEVCALAESEANATTNDLDKSSMKTVLIQSITPNIKIDEVGSSDTDTDHSTYSSTINIPGALTLECPIEVTEAEPVMKNEVNLQIENDSVLNGSDEEKMCQLLKRLGTDDVDEEITPERETEECGAEGEEKDRPRRIRRSSSLKTGKTPPGTPGRKKIVRFADVLGLDLADVRTFLDEIPRIPNSAYSDLIYDDIFQKDTSPTYTTSWNNRYADRRGSGSTMCQKLDRTLLPLFQQPGGLPNFLDIVRERCVCLENVVVSDPLSLCIQGTVRVINLDFHKSVHIRYTLNNWKNFSDLQATYVPNSCDGFSDKFSFVLYCHTLRIGQRLEFAVRFHCKGQQYWDNNSGLNYCFQCLPASSQAGYIPITASDGLNHDWSPMFY